LATLSPNHYNLASYFSEHPISSEKAISERNSVS